MFISQDISGLGVHSSGLSSLALQSAFPPPWQPDKPNWKDGLDGILINLYVGLTVSHVNFG